MLTEKLQHFFDLLGVQWVLVLLIILSVIAVAIMVERFLFLYSRRVNPEQLGKAIRDCLQADDRAAALAMATAIDSMEGRVLAEGIRCLDQGAAAVEEIVQSRVARERANYDKYLSFLGTLGNNAPFIGLFGTVLGIISSFANLGSAEAGVNRAQLIQADLAEALVATAAGLLVAIPSVIAYNQFKGTIRLRINQTEALSRELLAHLKSTKTKEL
jgi:biopolymer transport protein ExbB/TolQ